MDFWHFDENEIAGYATPTSFAWPWHVLAAADDLVFRQRAAAYTRTSATASGIIDGVGYLAGVLAGKTVAELSNKFGWNGAFLAVAGTMALGCVAAGVYLWFQRRPSVPGTPDKPAAA